MKILSKSALNSEVLFASIRKIFTINQIREKSLVLFFSLWSFYSFAQLPPCPGLNLLIGGTTSTISTGPGTVICNGQCVPLSTSITPVNLTNTYSVQSITYAPYSFTTGTSILANSDDRWSPVLNLGFPFCFYGNTFSQCKVGSNGHITFSTTVGSSDGWSISTAIPSLADMPGNTINAAFRDIDPTSSGNIYYSYYGSAPCRAMVISWNNIPMFDNPGPCSATPNSTFQIVLYETSNYIDVFIQNSSSCTGWNGGYGICGIQNATGTSAAVPPGRNYPATWSAVNEGWRFVPTGAPTYTLDWESPTGSLGSSPTLTVCPSTTTTYTAYLSVAACGGPPLTYSSPVTVSVVPGPTLTVNSATICQGAVGTLSVSGANTYTWITGGSNATSAGYSPSVTTIYTVQGSTGATCISQGTGTVTVNPLPTPTIQTNSPVCLGQGITLNGGGGASYLWTGPGGFTSTLSSTGISPSTLAYNGIFTLTVTDAKGCVNTTTQPYVVNPLPNASAGGASVCVNQTANLSSSGGTTYSWTGPGGYTSSQQNPALTNASASQSGQYSVLVTDANGCASTASAMVVVNVPPAPVAAANTPVCINNIVAFNANAIGAINYQWMGPNGYFSAVQNPTLLANSASFSGDFTVTASDAIGCASSTVVNVSINPNPDVSIISTPNQSCTPICVTFSSTASSSVQAASWILGDGALGTGTTVTNCYNHPGTYTVQVNVTDVNGCPGSTTYTVNAYPIPVADFNYAPIKPVIDDPVAFTDASHNANIISWNWYFTNTSTNQSSSQNPTYVYDELGSYVVALVVKSDKGCADTVLKNILVGEDFGIYVPDAFTPNDDGINDVFSPKGFGITKYEMEIFDRWGEQLFQASDVNNAWDGKYQGRGNKLAPEGVYVWRIKVTSVYGKTKELTGHVTLIK